MPIVIDSSAVIPIAMDDEASDYSAAALEAVVAEGGLAPTLFWFEIRNALLMSERRGRITPERAAAFLSDLALLPLVIAPLPPSAEVLTLARAHNLTIYDAAYLELAIRTSSPLATLDVALAKATAAAGGSVFTAG